MTDSINDQVLKPIINADLYLLTMSLAWANEGREKEQAVFEGFIRKSKREQMISCGDYRLLTTFYSLYKRVLDSEHLSNRTKKYLYSFLNSTLSSKGIKFNNKQLFDICEAFIDPVNKIYTLPDGAFIYPNVPFVQVTGNLVFCQIMETYILSCFNHGIGVASKAYELRQADPNIPIMEGGARRTDPDAAIWASYAAKIGIGEGFSTSLVGASNKFGIISSGTMAHSFVMSFDEEEDAFKAYIEQFGPENTICLIDTYDPYKAIDKVIHLCHELNVCVKGIRLDSGDIFAQANDFRKKLDSAGLKECKIFASNGLDTHNVKVMKNHPIDGILIGERLTQVADQPVTGAVYKLVEINGKGVSKKAEGKVSYPYRKSLYLNPKNKNELILGRMNEENKNLTLLGESSEKRYENENYLDDYRVKAKVNFSWEIIKEQ